MTEEQSDFGLFNAKIQGAARSRSKESPSNLGIRFTVALDHLGTAMPYRVYGDAKFKKACALFGVETEGNNAVYKTLHKNSLNAEVSIKVRECEVIGLALRGTDPDNEDDWL